LPTRGKNKKANVRIKTTSIYHARDIQLQNKQKIVCILFQKGAYFTAQQQNKKDLNVSFCALGFSIYSSINVSLSTLICMHRFFDVFSSNLIN
jgi:hypothetical protein